MYCPAVAAVKLLIGVPIVGIVAYVTPDSLHDEVTGERLTVPPEFTRLTNTVSVARETWLAVKPDGNVLRSNCSSAVFPLPT